MMKDTTIMTVSEVAEFLHFSEKTILKLAQKGEVPCFKIASKWRFSKPILKAWIDNQMEYVH